MNDMSPFRASELVLNADRSIYHLGLHAGEIADTILLVGDPDRVAQVSRHFDSVEHRKQKREFITHTGSYRGKRLSVVSTGIGTDNIDIVLNELDAVANIDLEKRELHPQLQTLNFIRLGTSGSLQPDLPAGSILLSAAAIGMDGLLHYYESPASDPAKDLLRDFLDTCEGRIRLALRPYAAMAHPDLLAQLGTGIRRGITVSCNGFYGPQGRSLRAKTFEPGFLDGLASYCFGDLRISNFEMETSGIYGLSQILGHRALSCNVILANRATGEFHPDPKSAVDVMIGEMLDRIAAI